MAERATIVELTDDHVDDAAGLLAERHRAQRVVESGLDPAYEDPAAARAEIAAVREREAASGVAAVAGGRVEGFLVGAPLEDTWGPNIWVLPAGHAVTEQELVRDLYAAAAERWVADGRTSHYAIVPATDDALVDAWFRLGFGHQHVHAIREVLEPDDGDAGANGLAIRPAHRDDLDALARLDRALPEHQRLSPVFSRRQIPSLEEVRAELYEDFDDEPFTTFVAERDAR